MLVLDNLGFWILAGILAGSVAALVLAVTRRAPMWSRIAVAIMAVGAIFLAAFVIHG